MEQWQHYHLWQSLGHFSVYLEWALALVVATGVVSAWRGAWLALDAQLWPQRPVASAALGLGWGCVLFALLGFLQPFLAATTARMKHRRWAWLADALFSYAGLWCCVLVWRGVWQLWDAVLGYSLTPGPPDLTLAAGAWLSHGVGVLLLLCIGGLRSLNAPPMLLLSDTVPPIFGARATSGVRGFVPGRRVTAVPIIQTPDAWHQAVGLPFDSHEAAEPNCASLLREGTV
mmetsp:Transcript_13999/g.26145  ORF Transcript_13999/g.26145 Transcript_13999/m.26145 type:complete len:230 (-) Transcript_13999:48-737(-)